MDPTQPENPTTPEINSTPSEPESNLATAAESSPASIPPPEQQPPETRALLWILLGPQGLRAGWSILAFLIVFLLSAAIFGPIFQATHLIDPKAKDFTANGVLFNELLVVLAMLCAAAVVALLERRKGNLLAYNLIGPHRMLRFFEGLVAGFVSLSLLMGGLAWGGWLQFGQVALSGSQIFKYAALWGCAFLLVGCFEEGMFRCYLQFTLTRSINFWWAFGILGLLCLKLLIFNRGNSSDLGVYILAGLGLIPCALLHFRKAERSGFWQASWVTTTMFGLIHTGNNGENWIGIFAAGAIGFVFVVSIRVTGSAWWAIGCHAAWDWAETYFYGAIDSGNVAIGHYLTVTPVPLKGSGWPVLWSGGGDGPEGSLLVIPILVLLLVALVVIYGRRKPVSVAEPATELTAG
jgi:membrane protease YdiL (CAAX protease family)